MSTRVIGNRERVPVLSDSRERETRIRSVFSFKESTKTGPRAEGNLRKRHLKKRFIATPCVLRGSRRKRKWHHVHCHYFSSTVVSGSWDIKPSLVPSVEHTRGFFFFSKRRIKPTTGQHEEERHLSRRLWLVSFLRSFPSVDSPYLPFPRQMLDHSCFNRGKDALSRQTAICQNATHNRKWISKIYGQPRQ